MCVYVNCRLKDLLIWVDDTSEAAGNADTVLIWKVTLPIKFQACSNLGWHRFSKSWKFEKNSHKAWRNFKLKPSNWTKVCEQTWVSKSCYLCKWSANCGVEIEGVCHLLYLCKIYTTHCIRGLSVTFNFGILLEIHWRSNF